MRPPKLADVSPLRAALYLRVSKDRKGRGKSVTEQEKAGHDAAEQENFRVDKVFTDNDRSASRYAKKERTVFLALLEYMKTGNVDVLILWESSRGSRELEEWAGLLNLCRRMGILIHVVSHGRTYDMENPRDRRTLAEDGVDSEYESEKTSKRVRRAMAASQEAGTPHGKLLYGYQRFFDNRGNASWEIYEEQAEIVREAARRAAKGESLYAIAQDLNARCIPTPRTAALPRLIENEKDHEKRAKLEDELKNANYRWDPTQIKRLCTNPAYIGKRSSLTSAFQWKIHGNATWLPILDEATYQTCVDSLFKPERDTRHRKDSTIRHLLSGLAGTPCGGLVRLISNRGYPSYSCDQDACVNILQSRLDKYVEAEVKEHLIRLEVRELDEPNPHEESVRARAKLKAEELRQYLEDFTKEAIAERLSGGRVAQVEHEVMSEIASLEATSRRPKIPKVVWTLIHEPELWDDMSMPEKREAVRRMAKITILKIGRGRRSYETSERVDILWEEDRKTYEFQAEMQAKDWEFL